MPQTIFITGASSGIGLATARHFHDQGWNVVATMRDPESLRTELAGERMLVTRLDVTDEASIDAAVAEAVTEFGRIDVLLNNAGYGAYGPLEATSMADIRRQYDVNVLGLYAVTKALLPQFRANSSGVIINVSSMGGKVTFPLGSLYHGSKFAVEGLSEALHYELYPLGIRVKVIEPGSIATDFAERSFAFSNNPELAEYQPTVAAFMGALQPMAAAASPADIVAATVYDAATDGTDRMRYVVGPDAEQLLTARESVDDDSFLAGVRAQFGIGDAAVVI